MTIPGIELSEADSKVLLVSQPVPGRAPVDASQLHALLTTLGYGDCAIDEAALVSAASMCNSQTEPLGVQVAQRLEDAQIANAQVNDMAGLWAHPQLAARQRWREVATPAGPVPTLLPPGAGPGDEPRLDAVPALGQHTDAILAELGLDAAAIGALRAADAV